MRPTTRPQPPSPALHLALQSLPVVSVPVHWDGPYRAQGGEGGGVRGGSLVRPLCQRRTE